MPRSWILAAASLLVLAACQSASAPTDAAAPASARTAAAERDDDEADGGRFSTDRIRFSFVVVGCNREDKADTNSAVNPSTANLEQLRRTYAEVAALPVRPKFFFFAGDLVFGYTPDTASLESQLRAWRAEYDRSPLAGSGTVLIPVPGNHEVQNAKKIAYAAAERTWLRVMGPDLAPYAGNGPAAGGADGLATDQGSLTYSFDYKNTHFLLLDTDPVGRDWTVPVKWIASDLDRAAKRQAKHIIAIGHKPAFAAPQVATDGLGHGVTATVNYDALRDEFWGALEEHHAEAMISAHNHVYLRQQPHAGGTWQVISGNGGSPLEDFAQANPATRFFGFTVVTVWKDGRVTATEYGRDVPAEGYLAPSGAYPTTVRDEVDLTWH